VFVCDFCERVEMGASAACEDDAFHEIYLSPYDFYDISMFLNSVGHVLTCVTCVF
jgi:hypothetical protein